jgi:hypothetical protein
MLETSAGKTTKGVRLVYGSERGLQHGLTIEELKRPGDASEWKGIPAGSMRLTEGAESEGNGATHTIWTGKFVDRGIYVTVESGVSRAAVVEAARALQPA